MKGTLTLYDVRNLISKTKSFAVGSGFVPGIFKDALIELEEQFEFVVERWIKDSEKLKDLEEEIKKQKKTIQRLEVELSDIRTRLRNAK